MRYTIAIAIVSLLPMMSCAQDSARVIPGGGISVPGWQGKADRNAPVNQAKLSGTKENLHVITGPAIAYWNPSDTASGNYTVKATFNEPKFMNLNDHPHPYGVFIAGNDMGTDNESYLYCAAYGSGSFIVRGFGPRAFKLVGGFEGENSPAVHKAAGPGQPVTQEIAMSVNGGKVSCSINGKTVATFDNAQVVAPGKLKSTNGVYGIRVAHNTEVNVTGLSVTKN